MTSPPIATNSGLRVFHRSILRRWWVDRPRKRFSPRGSSLRWEQLLLLDLDCRYRLPNFPRSPARWRRERQNQPAGRMFPKRQHAVMLIFLCFQLIRLRGDHMKSPSMELQPLLEFQILFHPTPARVEKEKTILQRFASAEVCLNQ